MSQSEKVHKIQIRNRKDADGRITVGGNVEVLLDGKPIKGCTFFKFEVKSRGIGRLMLEMFADVEVDANFLETHRLTAGTDLEIDKHGERRPVVLHQLGSYTPTAIATKALRKCKCCKCGGSNGVD